MSRADLAKIHIAKKEMQMDDGAYRLMLVRVTGKKSSAKMADGERQKVIAEFKRLGWNPAKTANWKKPSSSRQIRKVWALARALDDQNYWRLSWRKGLTALVKKETGVDHPDWMTPAQANQIIEMLKAIQLRVGS